MNDIREEMALRGVIRSAIIWAAIIFVTGIIGGLLLGIAFGGEVAQRQIENSVKAVSAKHKASIPGHGNADLWAGAPAIWKGGEVTPETVSPAIDQPPSCTAIGLLVPRVPGKGRTPLPYPANRLHSVPGRGMVVALVIRCADGNLDERQKIDKTGSIRSEICQKGHTKGGSRPV
jgi:hypothetical protein